MQRYRFLVVIVLCVSLVASSVFGVSAASYDPGYQYSYDILSLTTADGDNHVSVGASGSVTFELPYVLNGNYVDVLISTSSGAITAAQCGNLAAQQDLNVLAVSNRVFRVYGTINNRSFTELQLNLTTNNESTSVDFLSFRLFKPAVNIHQTLGRISCKVLSLDAQHYGQTSYGEVLSVNLPWETGSSEIDTASILLTAPQWQKYDYVEFMVYGKFSSLDAIVARVDSLSVPFTVTPVDGSADVFASHSDNVWRNLVISIDLRDVVRSNSLDEDLRLRVDINISYFNGAQATFYLNTVNGVIDSSVNVTDDYWWSRVLSALSSGFSSVVSAVNDMASDVVAELQSGFPGVVSAIQSMSSAVGEKLDKIYNSTSALGIAFTQWVVSKWDNFASAWNTKITGFQTSVENAFDSLWMNISARWDSFQTWLESVLDPDASYIDEQAGQIQDGLDSIEQIEQNFFQDFDNNAGVVTGAFNFASFLNAFSFVSTILTGTFDGLSSYQAVYTVPIAIAIFLFIMGHVPRHVPTGGRNKSSDGSAGGSS